MIGTPGVASADYGAALQAFRQDKYDVMTAEIRSSEPRSDPDGLRALVRAMDDTTRAKEPQQRKPSSAIPNAYEVGELLEEAADLVRDGESIYRLRQFVRRPSSKHPNRPFILRFKKAAEYGYALAQYQYGVLAPLPAPWQVDPDLRDLVISERESLDWIRRAAEGGSIFAQTYIANLGGYTGAHWIKYNIKDPELQRELKESLSPTHWVEWMEKAAANEQFENGLSIPSAVASARASLASAYASGLRGASVDYVRAYKWATMAANAGNELAESVLLDLRWRGYPSGESPIPNSFAP